MSLEKSQLVEFIEAEWESHVIPTLKQYIEIPNLSPMFDHEWESKGDTQKAVDLLVNWVKAQDVKGLELEVVKEEKRTPLIFMTVAPTNPTEETIMMYGHLDKQPPCEGWFEEEGIFPYKPFIKDDKLYGRGGADDGYSTFSAVGSIKALQKFGVPHARIVIIIEASEESGSPDLPFYIEKFKEKIGTPNLVVCLDSGCGNYEQFWLTTSLRGMCGAELSVQILKEGVHSGHASGIVPSSFRLLRQILNRLEDPKNGKILPKEFHVKIPKTEATQATVAGQLLGTEIFEEFPWVDGAKPITENLGELLLNRTWRPQLAVTGIDGLPPLETAGNVLRTQTTVTLSLRLPPTLSAEDAGATLKALLEKNPPNGARVTCTVKKAASGWAAPELEEWLITAVNDSSMTYFEKPYCSMGEGGSIPFMGMLGEMFPKAQFVITGVLGPKSNAHGPNEFLHIPMAKKLTCCIASIVNDHYKQFCGEQNKKAKTE